uniref:L-lactate dehydrogenase n=1 Tax=Trichobilharzia regenti TaxID=157069 RepID=A0AA85K654_TRIRE|nr:unnamed protein product [Trichobilharzia regenti]
MNSILCPAATKGTEHKNRSKISIIGSGSVGTSIAFSLLKIAGEIALIDSDEKKVEGEVLDLQQGQQFTRYCKIIGGSNFQLTTHSDIVVVTATADKNEDSKLTVIQKNVDLFKEIIPKIVHHSPDCILFIVTDPVDTMTHVAAKLSGLPKHRVLGIGTVLDSAVFRFLLGEKFDICASEVDAYIIGENGENSIPLWRGVDVAGVRLATKNPKIGDSGDPEDYKSVYETVIQSKKELVRLKGNNSWSVGLACVSVCDAIINNLYAIHPVSVYMKGVNGVQEDAFLGFPSLINSKGVSHVIPQPLTTDEDKILKQCIREQVNLMEQLNL